MTRSTRQRARRAQSGLTLVEIMVALAVGALLLAGVGVLFAEMRQSGRVERGLSGLQESARFALAELAHDLRMVGYFGCSEEGEVVNTLNGSATYDWDFDNPIQGHENTGGSTWSPALPARIADLNPDPDSDIFTIRSIETDDELEVTNHPGGNPPGSAALQVNSTGDLEQGDIVVSMDCPDAAVFQVTNVNGNDLVHNTGVGDPGNDTDNLQANFEGGSVAQVSTRTYFTRTDGDGNVGLWVDDPVAGPSELAGGVERLRVRYGEDTDDDRQVDVYRDADQVTDWAAVVGVEVSALVRSADADLTNTSGQQDIAFQGVNYGGDGRLRRIFQSTTALRNRLP